MISFVKNPEINLILSDQNASINKKSKNKDVSSPKQVEFTKKEIDVLKKLEKTEIGKAEEKENSNSEKLAKKKNNKSNKKRTSLSLNELKQLKQQLEEENLFLCDILENDENAVIELPKNEIQERNPELEARVQRLKAQQANKAYESMVRNVDARLKMTDPKDSIAFQSESPDHIIDVIIIFLSISVKQINRQLIAVAQFVFSVISGFVFGFIGIELIIGSLDFGFRLLLGIICALVIALAEIYFLAKKLVEEEDAEIEQNKASATVKDIPSVNSKEKIKTK